MGNEIHAKLMNCRDTSQKWSQSMHFNRFYVLKAVGPRAYERKYKFKKKIEI